MSEGFAHSERLAELAQLAATDPRRAELDSLLAAMEPSEREHWLNELAETDRLREELGRVSFPPEIQQRMLALPDEYSPLPWWKRALAIQVSWPAAVAAAVAVIAVAGYLLWQPLPALVGPLNEQVAQTIAERAVQNESGPALEISSGDAKQVESELSRHSFAFPVIVLKPTTRLDLRGGGVCDFGGTPAAFTRWQGEGGVSYTVFQFNGKPLGAPASFLRTTETPQPAGPDQTHHRVVIWPGAGAPCTWAVVMDSDAAADVFSSGY